MRNIWLMIERCPLEILLRRHEHSLESHCTLHTLRSSFKFSSLQGSVSTTQGTGTVFLEKRVCKSGSGLSFLFGHTRPVDCPTYPSCMPPARLHQIRSAKLDLGYCAQFQERNMKLHVSSFPWKWCCSLLRPAELRNACAKVCRPA